MILRMNKPTENIYILVTKRTQKISTLISDMMVSSHRPLKTRPQNPQASLQVSDAIRPDFPKILVVIYHEPCPALLGVLVPLQNVHALVQAVQARR